MVRTGVVLVGVLLLFGACGGNTGSDNNSPGGAGQGGTPGGAGGGSGGSDGGVSCKEFLAGTCGFGGYGASHSNQMDAYDQCMPQCTSDAQCAAGFICVRQRCRQSCTAAPSPVYNGGVDAGLNDSGIGYLDHCGLSGVGCPGEQVCVQETGGSQRLYCACADGPCGNANDCSGYCNL